MCIMVQEEPKVSAKARYSAVEAASLLGVHRSTLLRYVKSGKLHFNVRTATSRRYFTGAEILRLWRASY